MSGKCLAFHNAPVVGVSIMSLAARHQARGQKLSTSLR
ncbi:MAG: hypothetical protein OJF48_004521 [Afipia sp.]|nr:MAG: hypothetical protein OJF48_004521 [Afipia sp.]